MKTSINTLKSLLMGLALVATTSMSLTSCMDDLDEGLYANDFAAENMVIGDIDPALLNFYKNWRTAESINFRVTESNVINVKNTGTPWVKGNTTNNRIPKDLLDELVEDPSWEIAYSGFENKNATDEPYLIFYNEATGIARVLYLSLNAPTGNQMLFVVQAENKNAAWNHAMAYGVPACATQTARCINPFSESNLSDKFTAYVKPYNQDENDLNTALPFDTGWYAFDLDMSSYSGETINGGSFPDFHIFALGSNSMDINISGDMNASSSADINQIVRTAATSTAFGNFSSFKGILKTATHVYSNYIKPVVKIVSSGGTDVKSYVALGKTAVSDITTKAKPASADTTLWGNFSMSTTGRIESSGTISESKPSGVPQLNINKNVINPNCHFGQGIWNISEKPVIYTALGMENDNGAAWPQYYLPYFLDPTSIKVEINPYILAKAENIHVTSYACAYPKEEIGYTDMFAQAIYGQSDRANYNTGTYCMQDVYGKNFNLKCLEENGYIYKVKVNDNVNRIYKGTLTEDDVMIEPRIGWDYSHNYSAPRLMELPDLFIVVNLSYDIKNADGKVETFFYSKRFLPEIKKISDEKFMCSGYDILERAYFDDYSALLPGGKYIDYVLPELSLGRLAKELDVDIDVKTKKMMRRK